MSAGDSDARSPRSPGPGRPVRPARARGLTHASVTELELQFAQNPRSDAYIALCEAYLAQGRFMEAMVVSKKGIKAHPDAIEAKLLLSRVYASQKKYPRALQTLTAATAAHPDDARVFVLRARVKLDSGDQPGAVLDLKRALDLDPNNGDAARMLEGLGVSAPPTTDLVTGDVATSSDVTPPHWAPAVEPDTTRIAVQDPTGDLSLPPGPVAPSRGDTVPRPRATSQARPPDAGALSSDLPSTIEAFPTGDLQDVLTANTMPAGTGDGVSAADPLGNGGLGFGSPPGEQLAFQEPGADGATGGLAFSDAPRNEFNFEGTFGAEAGLLGGPPRVTDNGAASAPEARIPSEPATLPPMQVKPQRLEGEDELEQLAVKVAEEKENRGRPRTTMYLLVVLLLIGAGIVAQRFYHKYQVEQIDRLMTQAEPAFNRDTYGGYKQAAKHLERILQDYDPLHPLTLGRLAHTYAILWTEHGEPVKLRLDEILGQAELHAPEVSHTVAAVGLSALNTGKDRRLAAKKAYDAVRPMVDRTSEGGAAPTHADLTLGIIEIDLGEYDEAEKRLRRVKQVLPGVRAQVWHGRAAFRARRLGTALSAYIAASRAEPSHAGALAGQVLTHLDRGDLAGAAEALGRFDELQRDNPKQVSTRDAALAIYARSALMRADGQDGKANGLYEEAVRADPRNADFPFGLGRWLLQNDRAMEALVPLEQAVAMEPSRWVFHVEIAEAEMIVGQWEQAKANIDEALQLASDKPEPALALARWMRRRRQPDTEGYLHSLLRKYPSAKLGINLELGRLYRAQKKYRRAQLALESALGRPRPTPEGDPGRCPHLVRSAHARPPSRGDGSQQLPGGSEARGGGRVLSNRVRPVRGQREGESRGPPGLQQADGRRLIERLRPQSPEPLRIALSASRAPCGGRPRDDRDRRRRRAERRPHPP